MSNANAPCPVRIAILDMNAGHENRAMKTYKQLAKLRSNCVEIFDVRKRKEIPDLSYDYYFSTGGPDNPNELEDWGQPLLKLYDDILGHNAHNPNNKKKLNLTCHSTQIAAKHWGIGELVQREEGTIIGIHTQHIITPMAQKVSHNFIPSLPEELDTMICQDWRIKPYDNIDNGLIIPSPQPNINFVVFASYQENNGEKSVTGFASDDGYIVGLQWHSEAEVEEASNMFHGKNDKDIGFQKAVKKFHPELFEKMKLNIEALQPSHNIMRTSFDLDVVPFDKKTTQELKIA